MAKQKQKTDKPKKWRAIFVVEDLPRLGLQATASNKDVEAVIRKKYGMSERKVQRGALKVEVTKMLSEKGIKVELGEDEKLTTGKLLKAVREYLKSE